MLENLISRFVEDPLAGIGHIAAIAATFLAYFLALAPPKVRSGTMSPVAESQRQTSRRKIGRGLLILLFLTVAVAYGFALLADAAFRGGFFTGFIASLILFVLCCTISFVMLPSFIDVGSAMDEAYRARINRDAADKSGKAEFHEFDIPMYAGLIIATLIASVFWMFLAQDVFLAMGGQNDPSIGILVIAIIGISSVFPIYLMGIWSALVVGLMTY